MNMNKVRESVQKNSPSPPAYSSWGSIITIILVMLLSLFFSVLTVKSYFSPLENTLFYICLIVCVGCSLLFYFLIKSFYPKLYFLIFEKIPDFRSTINQIGVFVLFFCSIFYCAEYYNQHNITTLEKPYVAVVTKKESQVNNSISDLLFGRRYIVLRLKSHDSYNGKIFTIREFTIRCKNYPCISFDRLFQLLNINDKIILKVSEGNLKENFVTNLFIQKENLSIPL